MDQGSEKKNSAPLHSESLGMLLKGIRDGSFRGMYADWKWIMRYAKPYKGRIALYTLLGLLCSATGLASSVASKYVIDTAKGLSFTSNELNEATHLTRVFDDMLIGQTDGGIRAFVPASS